MNIATIWNPVIREMFVVPTSPSPLPRGMYEGVGWRTEALFQDIQALTNHRYCECDPKLGHDRGCQVDPYKGYDWRGIRRGL